MSSSTNLLVPLAHSKQPPQQVQPLLPWHDRSWVLLLICGTLIGINFPLAKIALAQSISPVVWVFLVSLGSAIGAGIVLVVSSIKATRSFVHQDTSATNSRHEDIWPKGQTLRYVLIAGPLTFAVPNLLGFSVLPHTGAGYAGLMFALSPVATLALSALFGLKTPGLLGLSGIATGMVGALLISYARLDDQAAPATFWILLALSLPLVLAAGNVYRTLEWPTRARPDLLAFWSYLFASLSYLLVAMLFEGSDMFLALAQVPALAAIQVTAALALAPFLFRLQQIGGPIMLSQMGYIAAAVSLALSTLFLNEHYSLITWGGAAVISIGIGMTIWANRMDR